MAVLRTCDRDPDLVAWWLTPAECVSALAPLERDGSLASQSMAQALGRLEGIARASAGVQPVTIVRTTAIRLLRIHSLRAAHASQLAAAVVAAEDYPAILPLVTLDDRLEQAAEQEGFPVVQPD